MAEGAAVGNDATAAAAAAEASDSAESQLHLRSMAIHDVNALQASAMQQIQEAFLLIAQPSVQELKHLKVCNETVRNKHTEQASEVDDLRESLQVCS